MFEGIRLPHVLCVVIDLGHSPGAAGRVILQHPVNIRYVDASGHHICAHQDSTEIENENVTTI